MRVRQLTLNNHQVIREATFAELNDFVVIAGPNGVGKTKIKDAICYIFQNSGNPPPDSSVTLEATNEEERTNWGSESVNLPNNSFWSYITLSGRKIIADEDRKIKYFDFQKTLLEDVPAIFLYFPKYNIAYLKKKETLLNKVLDI